MNNTYVTTEERELLELHTKMMEKGPTSPHLRPAIRGTPEKAEFHEQTPRIPVYVRELNSSKCLWCKHKQNCLKFE